MQSPPVTHFSDDHLDSFIAAWEKSYGERLSRGEAAIQLQRLVALYRTISRPLPQDMGDDGDVAQSSTQQAA
ncbi:hypothetical protein [Phenylobacterium aquaticum]|uniref:hypothetical protein n=1 Tax=Phenylobacterium aquaticum TaxID=1763816 RepID=UPI001F5D0D1B|nr:hypothetical protein [Phenylobacterium aquaticum]MCI3133127.1 hypothetical protein [Phenylobacterium aquaticum]